MSNQDIDFDTWFSVVSFQVLDQTGVDFLDQDSVRAEYDSGQDAYDVADKIAQEYT